jgi:hypothetical protein
MSVTIRAGKTGVNGQFVHIAAEQITPVTFQIVIPFVVFPEIRFRQSRLFSVVFLQRYY